MASPSTLRTWLVIVAMEVEEAAVLSRLPSSHLVEISNRLGLRARQATVGSYQLLVARSGVGAVNAALTLGFAAERFPLDAVLLLGVAGALRTDFAIGDMVIPERVIQHDAVCSWPEHVELMAPGQLHVSLPKEKRPAPALPADPALYGGLLSVLAAAGIQYRAGGTLLSGSEFVASPARKQELLGGQPDAVAVEMEAAGVAQVARQLGIPFLVVKTIADRLAPDGTIVEDYRQFTQRAAENAAQIVDVLARHA